MHSKSMDWFKYDTDLRHERVNTETVPKNINWTCQPIYLKKLRISKYVILLIHIVMIYILQKTYGEYPTFTTAYRY